MVFLYPETQHFQQINLVHRRQKIKLHNHLYSLFMQFLHHIFKGNIRIFTSAVGSLGSKIGSLLKAPVVYPVFFSVLRELCLIIRLHIFHAHRYLCYAFLLHKFIGRKQLQSGNTQFLQIRKFLYNSFKGSLFFHSRGGMTGKASYMKLIKYTIFKG